MCRSGALGLAVLSTIAANHTKGLVADHHPLAGALVDGYQLAFTAGAATIAAGIGLAFVLLGPRGARRRQRQLVPVQTDSEIRTNFDMEKQAA